MTIARPIPVIMARNHMAEGSSRLGMSKGSMATRVQISPITVTMAPARRRRSPAGDGDVLTGPAYG